MSPSRHLSLILTILLVLALSACNISTTPNAEATLSPLYTAQAQTLQALVTQAAQTALAPTGGPQPIGTPTAVVIVPTLTPVPATAVKSPTPASYCDWVGFVSDVSIPDGTSLAPGQVFTKTWRLKNIGTCTWTNAYSLAFVSGDRMSAPAAVSLPSSVAPGQSLDLSVNLVAPATPARYKGYFQLRNPAGVLFGVGSTANGSFWVDVTVTGSYAKVYDFAADYCSGKWESGAGTLSCPGTDGDAKGFVIKLDSPRLEDGTTADKPGLLTVPQNVTNGYIQGQSPALTIKAGDRFRTIVNCQYNATGCDVTFRLDYQVGSGAIKTLWSFNEKYEGKYYAADVDLSPIAGDNVRLFLTVLAAGSASGDRALWVNPRIERVQTPGTATPTPTASPTGTVLCNWVKYVKDVTVPDGTVFAPGESFVKTWRLKNIGSCTWSTAYTLVFVSGDQMSGPAATYLPAVVAPGQTLDLSVNLVAPLTPGHYKGRWMLRDASGVLFGIGPSATDPFWVDINVGVTPTPTPTATATP